MKAKLTALVAAIIGAILIPAALLAWGPDRTLYTMASPADHVTFNSIKDNPDQGDERNFVRMREAGVGNYQQTIDITPGKEYEVSVFYHNNASSSLNGADFNGAGIARDTKLSIQMPTDVKAGDKASITGIIGASNATPNEVWDTAFAKANQDMDLRYISGSATILSKGAVNGLHLSDEILRNGVMLGYNQLDGNLPGCNDFEGWVVFRFKAVAPDFNVEKTVAKAGSSDFAKSLSVQPGDTVQYKIKYENTGSTQQNNVVVKDLLPAGLTYVAGSTNVATDTTNGWKNVASNALTTSEGINIGNYGPESGAYVAFKATVNKDVALKCGLNTLTNKATIETDDGNKSSTADVTINKACAGQINVCDLQSKQIVTIDEDKFDASKHSKDLNKCVTTPGTTNPPVYELPKTGLSSTVASIFGLGTLAASATYYVRSRSLLRR